jgi:hypothetical protein
MTWIPPQIPKGMFQMSHYCRWNGSNHPGWQQGSQCSHKHGVGNGEAWGTSHFPKQIMHIPHDARQYTTLMYVRCTRGLHWHGRDLRAVRLLYSCKAQYT